MITYTEVLEIIQANLAPGSNITAVEHRAVEQALLDFAESQWISGDVKEVDCSSEYILANFESNGLGKNERLGWAICNGQNETRNRKGRTAIGYSDSYDPGEDLGNYPVIGAKAGWTDQAIIDHKHEYQDAAYMENGGYKPNGLSMSGSGRTDNDNGFLYRTRSGTLSSLPPASGTQPLTENPQFSTGSGTNKNMQPYIVTLFIQKI
jgi:hypothetical protein